MLEQINSDLKQAMLAKDSTKLGAIRGLKSAISVAQTAKSSGGELSNEEILSVIQKQIKQRKESADIYKTQNREDLYEVEMGEVNILESYLPQQLSIGDVKGIIFNIVNDLGATSIKDMGKVMGVASKQLAGRTDNKTISEIVKELLS